MTPTISYVQSAGTDNNVKKEHGSKFYIVQPRYLLLILQVSMSLETISQQSLIPWIHYVLKSTPTETWNLLYVIYLTYFDFKQMFMKFIDGIHW